MLTAALVRVTRSWITGDYAWLLREVARVEAARMPARDGEGSVPTRPAPEGSESEAAVHALPGLTRGDAWSVRAHLNDMMRNLGPQQLEQHISRARAFLLRQRGRS